MTHSMIWALSLITACVAGQLQSSEPTDPGSASTGIQEMIPVEQAASTPRPTETSATPIPVSPGESGWDAELGTDPPAGADLFEQFEHHLPDPTFRRAFAIEKLAALRRIENPKPEELSEARQLEHLLELVTRINRPQQMTLSLEDALHRALENSYALRVSSYNPAIATTQVVEREAVFDSVFYSTLSNQKTNQPTANALIGSNIEQFSSESGIRKLMPTGMQAQASYNIQRLSNDFQFQQINPAWTNNFVVSFSQPLLRGFGLDVNQAPIRIQKLNRRQTEQQFKRDVRDLLRQTEEAYWRLVQARRLLVVSARLLVSFQDIYDSLYSRKDYDVYTVQLADSKSRLESSKADFIRRVVDVRNAEDQLVALMNDPNVNLADEIEIIPTDFPPHLPVFVDRLAAVQTALDNRAEIEEARLGVDVTKIQVGVAKNQALPQFDVQFSYTVAGLGPSQHDAFSEVTKNDFHTYLIGLNFEIPLGNRGPRAALARSKLEHGQAIANLKYTVEQIILDVNIAQREVQVTHDQIEPTLQAANATEEQVRSIIARAERKDFLTLNNELNTRTSLATNQSNLLSSLVDYAIAIIDMERAKGTLLEYDRVELDTATPFDE